MARGQGRGPGSNGEAIGARLRGKPENHFHARISIEVLERHPVPKVEVYVYPLSNDLATQFFTAGDPHFGKDEQGTLRRAIDGAITDALHRIGTTLGLPTGSARSRRPDQV